VQLANRVWSARRVYRGRLVHQVASDIRDRLDRKGRKEIVAWTDWTDYPEGQAPRANQAATVQLGKED